MSIHVIGRVWRSGLYSGGTLLVLLAMADFGNDKGGRIFPSIKTLAEKSRMTDRQVRRCLRQLQEDGTIAQVSAASGRPGDTNHYRIVLSKLPVADEEEEIEDGGHFVPPDNRVTEGGHSRQERRTFATETADICDTHIDNRQEQPLSKPSRQPSSARGASLFDPNGIVTHETWEAFAAMRRKKRVPLTDHAADLIVVELRKLQAAGHDPTEVLNQSTRNAWSDVYPIKDKQESRNGGPNGRRGHSNIVEGVGLALERERRRPVDPERSASDSGVSPSDLDSPRVQQ